jgi:prevent-host-death family protein
MKMINIRDARAGLSELVEEAQKGPVCLTRHGKPVAVVTGVEGADLDAFVLESSVDFWREIQKRRKSAKPRVRIEDVRKKLGS